MEKRAYSNQHASFAERSLYVLLAVWIHPFAHNYVWHMKS